MTTNWYNEPPYKLIGHTILRELKPGEIVPFGTGVVHSWDPESGKRSGSYGNSGSTPRIPQEYRNAGGFVTPEDSGFEYYTKDAESTQRWLETTGERLHYKGKSYRPARYGEIGKLLNTSPEQIWEADTTWAFRDLPAEERGWTHDKLVSDAQMIWVPVDEEDQTEPELTADEEKLVNRVADFTNLQSSDEDIDRIVAEEIKQRERVKAAVLRNRKGVQA